MSPFLCQNWKISAIWVLFISITEEIQAYVKIFWSVFKNGPQNSKSHGFLWGGGGGLGTTPKYLIFFFLGGGAFSKTASIQNRLKKGDLL